MMTKGSSTDAAFFFVLIFLIASSIGCRDLTPVDNVDVPSPIPTATPNLSPIITPITTATPTICPEIGIVGDLKVGDTVRIIIGCSGRLGEIDIVAEILKAGTMENPFNEDVYLLEGEGSRLQYPRHWLYSLEYAL